MGFIFGVVLSFIFNIVLFVAKLILKIIKDLLVSTRLMLPVSYALVCYLLFTLGIIQKDGIYYALAVCGMIAVSLITIYGIIKKLFFNKKAEDKKKIENEDVKIYHNSENPSKNEAAVRELPVRPKIYRVKQNPGFIMYEYPDRVELFKDTDEGLKYVRTDYTK